MGYLLAQLTVEMGFIPSSTECFNLFLLSEELYSTFSRISTSFHFSSKKRILINIYFIDTDHS